MLVNLIWSVKKASSATLIAAILCCMLACTKELPALTANDSSQLTTELVLQASLSNDTKQAFLLTRGPVLKHWDIGNSRVIKVIESADLPANTRDFVVSDNETRLLTSDGKSLLLWRMDNFQLLGSLDFQQHLGDAMISAMAFISDTEFVVGNSDGTFIFADLKNQLFRRSHFHSNEVTKLLIDKSRTMLYSAGNDGRVLVTDLQLYEQVFEYRTPFRITSLISNHDHSMLFLSDALEQQVLWRPRQNRIVNKLDFFEQYRFFRLGLFLESDSKLLTTSPKTEISVWDTQSGKELARWLASSQSLGSTIVDLGLNHQKQLITLTSDAVVETWDLEKL